MKIFLPFKKELNPYLDEIINNSLNTYVYDNYLNYNSSYDFVNIHWPEAIFEWKEPTQKDLKQLEENILEWKKNSVLIYTKHDFKRNKGTTTNFTGLFELIEKYADVFIHLGRFSKKYYIRKYPQTEHKIIHHPIFQNSLKVYTKREARDLLGINQDAVVIIAPGNIRHFKERKMVLGSFRSLKTRNKVLISTNMRSELKLDFTGRVWLKKYFDVQKFFVKRFQEKHLPPQYIFNYGKLSSKDLSLSVSAADVVLVPRIDLLNSGIVFLGLTFGKVVVGPAIGNIGEQLKEINFPVFNPKSMYSVTEALENGIKLHLSGEHKGNVLEKYLPINVAKEYDRVFSKHKKS